MQSGDTRVLTSWKEIADHLDVTVRTAQLWEKQRGMPVRRMPGPRGRVYLRIDEYEAWLAAAGATSTAAATSPSSSAPRHNWPLLAGVAVVSVLFGMLVAPRFLPVADPSSELTSPAGATGSRVPTRAYVRADELIVENAAGEVLWRKRFEDGLQQTTYENGLLRPMVADVDGDGSVEILFQRYAKDFGIADILLCYADTGDELWRFRPGREVEDGKQLFDDIFRIGHYEPVDLGDGRRRIFVASIHHIYEPTQIVLLDVDGTPVAEYWHSGHLAHRKENLALADLDGNGTKEIYAGGVNNARQSATLVVLDPDTMAGASRDPHGFQLEGFETDREVARVFFPRSSMNVSENQYNFVYGVFPSPGGIAVGTQELYGRVEKPGIVYELALDLTLRHIGLGDSFKATHEKYVRQGLITPTTLETELERLWQQGIRVLRAGATRVANDGGRPR